MKEREPGRVLIVQEHSGGHRLNYVRLLIEAAIEQSKAVTLMVGFDSGTDHYFEQHLGHLSDSIEVVQPRALTLTTIRAVVVEVAPVHIVFPDGDSMIMRLAFSAAWPPSCTMSILIMRYPNLRLMRHPGHAARGIIKLVAIWTCHRIRGMRPFELRSAGSVNPTRRRSIEDPIEVSVSPRTIDDIRAAWQLAPGIFWVGIFGSITARKNAPLAAQALAQLSAPVGLLIAGIGAINALTADQAEVLVSAGGSLLTVDRLLSTQELDSAIAAVDCVAILHDNEGPSGIFGKAAALGTFVVAGGAHSLKADCAPVRRAVWAPLTVQSVSSAFVTARGAPKLSVGHRTHLHNNGLRGLLEADPHTRNTVRTRRRAATQK